MKGNITETGMWKAIGLITFAAIAFATLYIVSTGLKTGNVDAARITQASVAGLALLKAPKKGDTELIVLTVLIIAIVLAISFAIVYGVFGPEIQKFATGGKAQIIDNLPA